MPRKTSSSALVSRGTKFVAEEKKLTVWPSALMEGITLAPFAGEALTPAGRLATDVAVVQEAATPRQVLRTKIFSTPFSVLPRLEAKEEKAMSSPALLKRGFSLKPLAGVTPSGVETNVVEGVQLTVRTDTPAQLSRT